MTLLLKIAAAATALILPLTVAQAHPPQGSNEAQGYAQSHGAAGSGYGAAYARYGYNGRHRRN